ncbi:MAG: PPC domain-containing DNA-binding protein [Thermodesulfovibrionales bacterium]
MRYEKGTQGRIFVVQFDDGDDLLLGIREIARRESIRAAAFLLVGGMKEGRFVVGPRDETFPPVPNWSELGESHETFGVGTIFWEGDEPRVHFHGAYAKGDSVKAGCLREKSRTFLILEAIIFEVLGTSAVRERDEKLGLSILRLGR